MITRRHAIHAGTLLAAQAAFTRGALSSPQPKTLLILGGTGFIGPHMTREALRLGWKVAHFNRGKRDPGGVEGVETIVGDRNGQLEGLRDRKWDVMIDNSGYVPKFVKMSSDLLAPNVGHCIFVSSISAYADFKKANDENSPTGKLDDPSTEEVTGETYGPMKALCEQYVRSAFKGRAAIVRPGYIVGPLDPTDRFTYWPVRASRGGEMLAPGTPRDPVQVIDARDLTAWMIKLADKRETGNFNAVTPPGKLTIGDIIEASQKESAQAGTKVTWVSEDFLEKTWKPAELDLPPWAPTKGDYAGASLTVITNAARTGLEYRPLQETVHDTLAWFRTLPEDRQAKLKAGLDPKKEADTLAAWHASGEAKS
jgi:2'-hydroxyisoflavone reductase